MFPVIALMATYPRMDALQYTSLPSIAHQLLKPEAIVIVADRCRFNDLEIIKIQDVIPNAEIHFLSNQGVSGVADTWNTGLTFIKNRWPDAYVAILDDDDSWECNHLSTCMETLQKNDWADVVISGLRILSENKEIPRPLISELNIRDFLVGNPGWQGSNTFAKITTLIKAGGFTKGLHSCNDRDLAIRLLLLENIRITFTDCFTASWNLNVNSDSLSQPSGEKRKALRQFFNMYREYMDEGDIKAFLVRSEELFGFSASDLA